MTPKKFKRGMRVRLDYTHTNPAMAKASSWQGKLGTIINPDAETWQHHQTKAWVRQVTVRLDDQQPHERGVRLNEADLILDTSGDNQFNQRHYTMHWLTHDQVALMRRLCEQEGTDESEALLKRIPTLPG